jgi:sugar/nucleoside kinase (ribokinase family)
MPPVRICTLGDLLLDVIVRLDQPFARGDDAPAHTRTTPGGQAANVAAWAAALGGEARFIGKRGDDEGGGLAQAGLARLGVDVRGPVVAGGRTGMVVSVVEPGGDRTMLSDRGVSPELGPADIDPAWLDGCARLHVSGYSLLRLPHFDAALAAAAAARAHGALVSVDLSSAALIETFGVAAFRDRIARLAPDIVLGNEAEHATLGPAAPGTVVAVKRGARGCSVTGADGEHLDLPALPADVIDTTGAGDAFAGGFLLGGTLREAAERGLAASARCVATLGSMPA